MIRTAILALLFLGSGSSAFAQAEQAQPQREPPVKLQPGATPVPGECLTREQLDLIKRLQALTRPTLGVEQNGDDQPPFNPHYFIGKWTIEGVLPESPLAPAGEMTGVETVRHVDGCTYESTIQAKGPNGAFTVTATVVYDRKATYLVRLEQDSRGFQPLKMGPVGGDAGGYFTYHWEAPPFTYNGKRVRLKGSTFLASPDNYRLRMQISVDDQPFVNYGTTWWRREGGQP